MGNDFIDSRDLAFNELLLTIPLTVDIKYEMQPNYAFRLDFTNNISFGSGGLETMDNISLSAGIEWHYGGTPKSYFPWNAWRLHQVASPRPPKMSPVQQGHFFGTSSPKHNRRRRKSLFLVADTLCRVVRR